MHIPPVIKGQITKAIKAIRTPNSGRSWQAHQAYCRAVTRDVLARYMPREQAKHLARKYLASLS